ncbi:cellulase family glycosylhydrolase [Paracoccus sp. C2R09]|nr:cellulase family glycosylhydrolase [Paracoccus sp. C2R09]
MTLAALLSGTPALPDQDAETGAPIAGLAVGLDALRWQSHTSLVAEFMDYHQLGLRWLRTDLNWASVQSAGPDSYDWRDMDRIVAMARMHDMKVLPAVGSLPDWAWTTDADGRKIRDARAFGRFMQAAAERYAPQNIHVWEIWNEPNLQGPFPPHPDASAYAALLKEAAAAIRDTDPGAIVLLGGLAAVMVTDLDGDPAAISALDFLETIYAEGAGSSFDAVGFHPYTGTALPDPSDPQNGWGLMSGPLRDIMAANGDGSKPIWVTEYGAPTNIGGGGTSHDDQARMLGSAADLAQRTPWIDALFWYSYRDLGDDPQNREDWFGLIDAQGHPKPARAAFERILLQLQKVR